MAGAYFANTKKAVPMCISAKLKTRHLDGHKVRSRNKFIAAKARIGSEGTHGFRSVIRNLAACAEQDQK